MQSYNLDGQKPSFISQIVVLLDFFRYIPIPSATPVSTKPSKIASLLFICFVISFTIYNLVMFITNNVPKTNAYVIPNINTGPQQLPDIYFQIVEFDQNTGESTAITDNTNINITFLALLQYRTHTIESYNIPLYFSDPYLQIDYQALNNSMTSNPPTFQFMQNNQLILQLNGTTQSEYRPAYRISYQLILNACSGSPQCQPLSQTLSMLQNTVLQIILRQPAGYDYIKGKPIETPTAIYYQYSLSSTSINEGQFYFEPTTIQIKPNLLTTFKKQTYTYTRMENQVSVVTPYMNVSQYKLASFILVASQNLNFVQITPTTIIQKLSEVAAFVGLVSFGFTIVFLTYNRRLFHAENPGWRKFDRMLQKRLTTRQISMEMEMSNLNANKQSINQQLKGNESSNQNYLRQVLNQNTDKKQQI